MTFTLNFFRDNDCAALFPDLGMHGQDPLRSLLRAFAVIEEFLPRWSVLGAVLDRGQLVQPRLRTCGVGRDYVVIDHRGRVSQCHMQMAETLGDVFTHGALTLVREDRTSIQNLAVDDKHGCRECTWRYWCSGGCPVAAFRATGRFDVPAPNCELYRALYPAALRLEGLRILRYAGTRQHADAA